MNEFLSARRGLVSVALVLVAAATVSPATAGQRSRRVVSQDYVGFRGAAVGGSFVYPTLPTSPTIGFDARPGETLVRIDVSDESGLPVRASVWYDASSDGFPEAEFEICGSSDRIRIPSHAYVGVDVFAGTCSGGGASTPLRGVVRATFFSVRSR